MYKCVTTQVDSSLTDLYTGSWSTSHIDLCHFKVSFLHLFTCVYSVCIYLPPPSAPGRTCSTLLFSDFVEEKTKDNNKNMAFLLVWDKDNYTGLFLVLVPCIFILQPKLVHLYQSSSVLPSSIPIVASTSLRLRYLFLYSEHINLIQVFGFLPLPYLSHAW
jgi:hypothetical protein